MYLVWFPKVRPQELSPLETRSAAKASRFLRATFHSVFLTLLCIFTPCPTLHPVATSVLCVPKAGLGFWRGAPFAGAEETEPLAPGATVSLGGISLWGRGYETLSDPLWSSAALTDGR